MSENILFFGDNLEVMREHLPDAFVDLAYLDPPFNSQKAYNVLFEEPNGRKSQAQTQVYEDSWTWTETTEKAFGEIFEYADPRTIEMMKSLKAYLGDNNLMAYLTMMCIRLIEIKRTIKPTGSIYIHCDPTASHYLKILMDALYGIKNFRSEIIWRRTGSHNKVKRYAPVHDVIFFYTMSDDYCWNYPKRPYMKGHVEENFIKIGDRYRTNYYGNVLTGSGRRGGESGKPWKGINPTEKNRHWALPGALIEDIEEDFGGLTQHEKLDRLYELGHIKIEANQAWPIYERYLNENNGQYLHDIWAFQPHTQGTVFGTNDEIDKDVKWMPTRSRERMGFQTQKPQGVLDRIIRSSSNQGDIVFDPFCGCGTTIFSAARLGRKWIGIDITHLAIAKIKARLSGFGSHQDVDYTVHGEPRDVESARALATKDAHGRYEFQWWVLDAIQARPNEGKKKGSDAGIDGFLYFQEGSKETGKAIVSVKSGGVRVDDIRVLASVVEREKAHMGIYVTLVKPTKPMEKEAVGKGFYHSDFYERDYRKIQILTIEDIFNKVHPDTPPIIPPHKKGAQSYGKQQSLL